MTFLNHLWQQKYFKFCWKMNDLLCHSFLAFTPLDSKAKKYFQENSAYVCQSMSDRGVADSKCSKEAP